MWRSDQQAPSAPSEIQHSRSQAPPTWRVVSEDEDLAMTLLKPATCLT